MPRLVVAAAALCISLVFSNSAYSTVLDVEPEKNGLSTGLSFDAINSKIRTLWSGHLCFKAPHSNTHSAIRLCWLQHHEEASLAREKTNQLVDHLNALRDIRPLNLAIVQSKLNLMTRAGLFCEQSELPAEEIGILSTHSVSFREWISSLQVCAQDSADTRLYDRMRGSLEKNIRRYSKIDRVSLLQLWFDSFIFQYSSNGDLFKVASMLNSEGVEPWKVFVVHLRKDVTSYNKFSASTVSQAEIIAARRALSAER